MKANTSTTPQNKKRVRRHASLMQHKVTTIIAFTTAIFLLCLENVKAFAAPLSSPDTLFMIATGVHSIAKSWKPSEGTSGFLSNVSNMSNSPSLKIQPTFAPSANAHTQRKSLTSLKMAFGFGMPVPSAPAPQMLDMKTSINAFGSWYNHMDPVARPPIYDE
jgi:hypothetical protein